MTCVALCQVEYRSGTEVCGAQDLKPINCRDGFEERGGNCTWKEATACGNLTVVQDNELNMGSYMSNVSIQIVGAAAEPDLVLSRVTAEETIPLTNAGNVWSAALSMKNKVRTGKWQLQYRSTKEGKIEICNNGTAKRLEEVKCLEEGFTDSAGKCVRLSQPGATVCDSAHVALNGQPVSDPIAAVSGARLRVHAAAQYSNCSFQVVPLDQAKTQALGAELLLKLPGKHQVSIVRCGSGQADCMLRSLDISCPDRQKNVDGVCVRECLKDEAEVTTVDGACVQPSLKAMVQSNQLNVIIRKPNRHLRSVDAPLGNTSVTSATVEIHPGASYEVAVSHTLKQWVKQGLGRDKELDDQAPWVTILNMGSGPSEYSKEWQLKLNATGFADATQLAARLTLQGQVQGIKGGDLNPQPIELQALVRSTPSLELSTIHMPLDATQGSAVDITIKCRDVENITIVQSLGRFLQLQMLTPGGAMFNYTTTFNEDSQDFSCQIPSSHTSAVGIYKLWVSEVFTYTVLPSVHALAMPTAEHPMQLHIVAVKETDLNLVLGGLIGGVLTLCIGLLLFYIRRNPKQAKKLFISFLGKEAKMALKMMFESWVLPQ